MQQSTLFHETKFISKASPQNNPSLISLHNETDINPIPRDREVEISKYKYSLDEIRIDTSNFSFLFDDACIIKTQLTPCYLQRGKRTKRNMIPRDDFITHIVGIAKTKSNRKE